VTPGLTDAEPLVAVLEVHPAAQLVASVEVQLRLAVIPWSIVAGDADRLTAGSGAGGGVLPPSLTTVVCALATCSCFRLWAS
jgi:hypothetical protein